MDSRSIFERIPKYLTHGLNNMILPARLEFIFGHPCRYLGLIDHKITLVIFRVLEHQLHNRITGPIIKFPLHFYVLSRSEGQKFALDPPLQD